MTRKAFINARIIPVEGDVIEKGSMIVEDGVIKGIGQDLETTDCEVVDCSGKTIVPGFIDAHSHVGLFQEAAGRGASDGNEMTSPITPHLRALDAIFPEDMGFADARSGGVTTMGVTPGSGNLIGGQFCAIKSSGHIVDDMIIKEPAGVKMALGENPKRVGSEKNRAPNTRMANAFLIREAFYEALDYAQEWEAYNTKMQKDGDAKQPKRNLKLDMLNKILRREVPVRCHSHRADDIRTAIRLADEFGYDLVIDHATESHKIKEFIAARGLSVVVGPLVTSRSKLELKDRSLRTPGIMMKEGVRVCITTDAPVIPIYALRDTVITAVREGLPEDRALETITINPAKVLGVDDRVGSLKVGKDADFLIFGGDPLDARNRVLETYIDGKLVFKATD